MKKSVISLLTVCFVCTFCAADVSSGNERSNAPIELSVVHFSHLDLSWLGTQKECESRFSRIMTEVIRKAEANPDYRFFVDNVYMLHRYMTLRPEQSAVLQRLVRAGQIEVNPQWGMPHTDDNIGESNVRNIFYAKQFLEKHFGIDPIALSYTDLPEWMVQTPQILKGCGIDFALMNRLGPRGVGSIPLLWWEGLDGSRILTASIGYQGAPLQLCGITTDFETMKMAGFEECCKRMAESFKTTRLLSYLGRDFWLPVENLERNIVDWNKISDDVKVRLSTFSEYYEKIKDLDDLPVFRGEVPDAWMLHVVFNPLSVHVTFYPDIIGALEKIDWQAHPGLAQGAARAAEGMIHAMSWPTDRMVLEDDKGRRVDLQKTYTAREKARAEVYFVFMAEDVNPLGYRTYYVYQSKDEPQTRSLLRVEKDSMENRYLRVDVSQTQGTFSVYEKDAKRTVVDGCTVNLSSYKSQLEAKSGGPPEKVPVTLERTDILERGPVRAKLRLIYGTDHPCIHGLHTELSITNFLSIIY